MGGVQKARTGEKIEVDSKQELNNQTPGPGLELVVDSYDFAAYGKIKVELLSLISPIVEPQPLDPGTLRRGRVKDRPGEEDHTTLPVDRGEGQGTAGNKIADGGWEAMLSNLTGHVDDTFNVAEDLDCKPEGNTVVGDGLVALEEYRGFKVSGSHIRTDPERKDLFIHAPTGIGYAGNLPEIPIHIVTDNEYDGGNNTINFLSLSVPAHADQCALLFNVTEAYIENNEGIIGKTYLVNPSYESRGRWLPCEVTFQLVSIGSIKHTFEAEYGTGAVSRITSCASAHEIGHGVFISHYNWLYAWDPGYSWWSVMIDFGIGLPPPQEIVDRYANETPTDYELQDTTQIQLFPFVIP